MALNLDSFMSRASTIDGNRSIYLNSKGQVKDEGAFRTFFTRKDTFRTTTNEFLNALQNEFGQEIGGVARDLLRQNIEAGKPLKASLVKTCVTLAQQSAMRSTLLDITETNESLTSFVSDLTHGDVSALTPEQAGKIKQYLIDNHQTLMQLSSGKLGYTRQSLLNGLQHGGGAHLTRTIDLITGNQNSPLVRLGYPNERDPQVVQDKLQVLNMLQTLDDGPEVRNPTLIQGMTALQTIRANNPAPGEFTAADLFNAVFPENSTPTLNRPSNEEIALYTPNQLRQLFDKAQEDFHNNFSVDMLPENSPIPGSTEGSTASALTAAKERLMMPSLLSTLSGDRITLADLPQLPFEVSVNDGYPTMQAAMTMLIKDLPRRGTMGQTSTSLPPTITFRNVGEEPQTVTIGSKKFADIPDEQLTDDQKAYNKGRASSVSQDLEGKINSLADTPAQAKAIAGCLTQSGSFPIWHVLQACGDAKVFREHSAYSHTVTKNQDGSVDVSLKSSPDLKGPVGTVSMTYHIDADGRTGITQFQWDKPSLQERKHELKTCTGTSMSIPSKISSSVHSLGLTGFGATIFTAQASAVLNAKVDAATTQAELPDMDSIREFLPPGIGSDPSLSNLAVVAQNQMALRFYMTQPEENREAFTAAAVVCQARNDGVALAIIQDFMPQLKELYDNGNLNADTAWQAIFDEPMPESARKDLGTPRSSPFSGRSLEKFTQNAPDPIRASNAYGSFFAGFKYNTAMAIRNGTQNLTHITRDMMRPDAALIANDLNRVEGMENTDAAEKLLGMDLVRMNVPFIDTTGKLETIRGNSTITINLPSGKEGAPAALTLDPLHPQGLTPEQQIEYERGHISSVTADIRERITNFCGKDHACQITNAVLAVSQNGRQFIRDMPGLLNLRGSEHCQANISVFADDQRNVHVRYDSLENSNLKFNYEFSFDPAGGQTLVSLDMHRADVE